jgi:hypothetical protein
MVKPVETITNNFTPSEMNPPTRQPIRQPPPPIPVLERQTQVPMGFNPFSRLERRVFINNINFIELELFELEQLELERQKREERMNLSYLGVDEKFYKELGDVLIFYSEFCEEENLERIKELEEELEKSKPS